MRCAALVACALATAHMAAGQQEQPREVEALPESTRRFVVISDPVSQLPATAVEGGRVDPESGVYRAVYRIPATTPVLESPDATARAYLEAEKERFGWTTAEDLQLVDEHAARYSRHLTYQQIFAGVPVYNRFVKVSLGSDGRPAMVTSGYAPHLEDITGFNPAPRLDESAAVRIAGLAFGSDSAHADPARLVVYPDTPPRLAWKMVVWTPQSGGEWEVLVDAATGELIFVMDKVLRKHPGRRRKEVPARVNGSGLVFDPDPLTSSGQAYGGQYRDRNDADSEALNNERVEVTLHDISLGSDGLHRLQGPHVRIVGTAGIGGTASVPPAESDPNAFRYTRADDNFEAVMAYYHIDASERYIRSLNLDLRTGTRILRVNPHGLGDDDNSAYYGGLHALAFGDGGIDDAEDAEVIIHEYGHAVLNTNAPGIFDGAEGNALHEGWADYWAVSYTRGLMDAGVVPPHDWRHVFSWDGNETWRGRRLNRLGNYGEVTECHDGFCQPIHWYSDGAFWATAVMEIYDDVGKETTDRLALYSQLYLGRPASMLDAAAAFVQADADLFGGRHLGPIISRFGQRNLLNPADFGPRIAHAPLTYVDPEVTPRVTVMVVAIPTSAEIARVRLLYRTGTAAFSAIGLARESDSLYTALLTVPTDAHKLHYFVEAEDLGGLVSRLPTRAPDSTFTVILGRDTQAPRIWHAPPSFVDVRNWPPEVRARVEDNHAVDSVWVEFAVSESDGGQGGAGAFGLPDQGDDRFAGRFPESVARAGDRLRYRIWARDAAASPNVGSLPADTAEAFAMDITEDGVLAAYGFEGEEGLLSAGVWERGSPAYGLQVARSGNTVWATGPAAPYPGTPGRAWLELPSRDLSNYGGLDLEFWHWYDLEHENVAGPGPSSTGVIHDGANVKASYDQGLSWVLLQPAGGYTGTVAGGLGNPLEHEAAYGGYSYGWRRVRMHLPGGGDVRVRFELGTNRSNVHSSRYGYAGWAIDDVRLLVETSPDTAPPALGKLPEALMISHAGTLPPGISITAEDNSGVDAALVDYTYQPRTGSPESGTVRLEMDPASLELFSGAFPLRSSPEAGARITYTLRVSDYDGNSATAPPGSQPPYVIEVQLAEEVAALAGAVASGAWRSEAAQYTARGKDQEGLSSLHLGPFYLPDNPSDIAFELGHSYSLGEGFGANVKLWEADRDQWTPLLPEAGISSRVASGPLGGELAWTEGSRDHLSSVFRLTSYTGRQIRLRLDFGVPAGAGGEHFWQIHDALLAYSTPDDAFHISRELALHPNFPDPFAHGTTVQYTLPEASAVRLEVYNILGQRVGRLVAREQAAGTHTVSLERGDLASGLYFIRMLSAGQQFIEPMIIQR